MENRTINDNLRKRLTLSEQKNLFAKAQTLFEENRELYQMNGRESQIKSNKQQIWLILYQIISIPYMESDSEPIGNMDKDIGAIKDIIDKYDPEKTNASLENFANALWAKRKKTTVSEKAKTPPNPISLDKPIGEEEEEETIGDSISVSSWNENGPTTQKIVLTEESIENFIQITTAINQLKQNDDNRKLVFTDCITDFIKNEITDIHNPSFQNREQSIINGMIVEFLDLYMEEICRTLKEIQDSHLKVWGKLKEWEEKNLRNMQEKVITNEEDQEEITLPLPNKVYTCFLLSKGKLTTKSSAETSVSQSKDKYKTFLKQLGLQTMIQQFYRLQTCENTGRELQKDFLKNSPIRDIILEKISDLGHTKIEQASKKLYEEIEKEMTQKCEQIRTSYSNVKLNADNHFPDIMYENYAKSYITSFIEDWRTDFGRKYIYYKNKKVNSHVSVVIKELAISEIQRTVPEFENEIEVILKAFDYEFAEQKQMTGMTICDTIEQTIRRNKENEIINEVEKETQLNRVLISDTIRAIKKSKSKEIKKIVKLVQDDNLYRYFWI